MKRLIVFVFLPVAAFAEMVKQSELDPAPILSVGLYKNGLAVVTRRITPDANGVARVDGACRPAYGTFWHSADKPVTITAETADLLRDRDEQAVLSSWTDTYAGREVLITFRTAPTLSGALSDAERNGGVRVKSFSIGEKDELFALKGTVVAAQSARKPPTAQSRRYYYGYQEPAQPAPTTELTLRLKTGSTVVIPEANVVAVRAEDGIACGIERQAPIWRFEGAVKPFVIQYLTDGATWTPSYRLDLRGEKGLISMATDLHNEMMDWDGAEVSLISGFPNLLYAGVPSLLGWGMSFNLYRDAVNAAENADPWAVGAAKMRSGVMSQSVMMNSAPADGFDISAAAFAVNESGAGSDIHYRSIGQVSLKKGATRSVPLGAGETAIKRIVDWNLSDTRDEYGRNRNNDNKDAQILWDAVRFTNPFDFPMTTAPIEVTEERRILGQAKSTWTNPGDTTLVKITKALSVTGSYSEVGDGKTVSSKIGSLKAEDRFDYQSRHYRREIVTGTFVVQNFRNVPASLIVKKTISGEIMETSIAPTKNRTPPTQDCRVNLERVLTWEFDLQPGEKREFTLTYWLWVLI